MRVLDGVGFVIFDMAANINWGDAVFISLHFLNALTKHCIVRMNSMFGNIHMVSQGGLRAFSSAERSNNRLKDSSA